MSRINIHHIFLDMDGVIADFITAALNQFDALGALNCWPKGTWCVTEAMQVYGTRLHEKPITEAVFWERISGAGEYFWSDQIKPYPWTWDLMVMLRSLAPLTIATTPSQSPHSLSGKLKWLNRHLYFAPDGHFRDYLMGPQKHLLAQPGCLLIDDNDNNVDRFREHGGEAILFPQLWNRGPNDNDPMAFLEKSLGRYSYSIEREM